MKSLETWQNGHKAYSYQAVPAIFDWSTGPIFTEVWKLKTTYKLFKQIEKDIISRQ